MTLHISAIMQGNAIQVSDRLASTTTITGTRRFNPAMNKNVIYQATDGLVSIGVSGRAYLDCIPQRPVVGREAHGPRPGEGAISFTVGGQPDRNLLHAVESVRIAAEVAFRRLRPSDRCVEQSFAIVGWQRRDADVPSRSCGSSETAHSS
jgi:hypothetical protein